MYRITVKKVNYSGPWVVLKTLDVADADLNEVLDQMGISRRAVVREHGSDLCMGEYTTWEEIGAAEEVMSYELSDGDVILYGPNEVRMIVGNVDTSGATTTYHRRAEAGYGRSMLVETGARTLVKREIARLAR